MSNLTRLVVSCSLAAAWILQAFASSASTPLCAEEPAAAQNPWVFHLSVVLLNMEDAKLCKADIKWNETTENGSRAQAGIRTAVINAGEVAPLIESLQTRGCQILSRPHLMTIEGERASVQSGGELPAVEELTNGPRNFGAKLATLEFGTKLCVIPTCLSPERAFLELALEHGVVVERGSGGSSPRIPVVSTQKLSTALALNRRQSLIVATPAANLSAEDRKAPRRSLIAIVTIEELKRQADETGAAPGLNALQGEVRALQREVARLQELVAANALVPKSSQREIESVPAMPPPRAIERAVAAEPVEWRTPSRARLITKAYAVADLVVPVPDATLRASEPTSRLKASELFAERDNPPPAPKDPEFRPLMDLVTSIIEPDSWERRGGPGTVHSLEKNLSLVISQTPANHEKIAEMLEKLRWLQDHSVELEISLVTANLSVAEGAGLDLTEKGRLLSPERARLVKDALAGDKDTNIITAPRLTMFNKQLCEVQTALPGDRRLHLILHGAIGEDLRTVRLNLAVNPRDAADAVRSGVSVAIPNGETFVLDATDRLTAGRELGVPLLSKVPHLDRLFKNVRPAGQERTLLLVTSRVRGTADAEVVEP